MPIENKFLPFKADIGAILKRYCCHGNVIYKFILTTIGHLTCFSIQIDLLNYYKE